MHAIRPVEPGTHCFLSRPRRYPVIRLSFAGSRLRWPATASARWCLSTGYADKHRSGGRPVYLLGVEFSAAQRNTVGWDVERSAS